MVLLSTAEYCSVLLGTAALSVKQERRPAGTQKKRHFHTHAQQFFFVLAGVATFYLEEQRTVAGAQQGLLIKPEIRHYIANENPEPLDFLVISQPATTYDRPDE